MKIPDDTPITLEQTLLEGQFKFKCSGLSGLVRVGRRGHNYLVFDDEPLRRDLAVFIKQKALDKLAGS